MGIATYKPTSEPEIKPELPQVEPANYKSVIYDDNNIPLQSLIAFVEGAPWTVNYYAQVLSKHNDLRDNDPGQSAVYQQYLKFMELEIRVDQALSSSYDAATGITKVTGTATAYPFMKVNVGDCFITDTADNKKSIFKLTLVERNTFNRDSAWKIEYELLGYVDVKPEVFADLEQKTIKTYYFSKDRLLEGLQPFIKSEEYQNVTNIRRVFEDIVQYYFRNLFNPKYSTIVTPGQEYVIYDSNMIGYLLRTVSTDDAPEVRKMKQLPTDNDPYLTQPEFWNMLFERDYDMRSRCNDVMGLVTKYIFNMNTYLNGFRYSNVDYLVYPDTPDVSANVIFNCDSKLLSMQEIITTSAFKDTVYTSIDNEYVTPTKTYEIIHEVLVDNKYVLSADFYNDTANQSLLEILVKDYLKHQALDLNKLYACCNVFKKWKRLEQYYYGPILMTLLMEAYRSQYT